MDKMKLLKMSLEDLSAFAEPEVFLGNPSLPEGYSLRRYSPGLEKEWIRIQDEADDYIKVDKKLFKREFGTHLRELPRRMLFLAHGKNLIGTATAWLDDISDEPGTGRLHWVAIVPEYQGRGLGITLTHSALSLFPALGCSRAYLLTNAVRIPAINLYLKIGFKPLIGGAEEQSAWEEILDIIESLHL